MITKTISRIIWIAVAVSWASTARAQTLTNAYSQAVLADNPVVYYQFQESPGATTALDSSGNGNDGTYNNTSLGNASASALLGHAAGFSGNMSSLVAVPALGAAYSLGGSGNDQATFEAWIQPAALPGSADAIYTVDHWVSGIVHWLVLGTTNTSIRFTVAGNAPNYDINYPGSTAIKVGEWTYVAVVYDDSTGAPILYVNGKPFSTNTTTYSTTALPLSLDVGAIGVQTDGGDPTYNGLVDEFAIYTTALSPDRIQAHFAAAGPINVSANLVFTLQPQDTLELVGATATFSTAVNVVGSTNAATYQWQTNGVNIAGATSATYTTPALTLADNGTLYDCVVSAIGATNKTTRSAQLTVLSMPSMSYEDTVKADNPVVYYRFEEASGATNAVDSSGLDNTGLYMGVVSRNPSATPRLGQAAWFPGTSSSFVAVPALPGSVSLGGGGDDQLTFEAWINPLAFAGSVYTSDVWNNGMVHFLAEGNGLSMRFTIGNASPDDENFPATPAFALGEWAHVVLVYDYTTLSAVEYINGEPVGTNVWTGAYALTLDAGAIGVQTDGGDPPFNGLIDEVAIYTNALSLARIQAHYAAAGIVQQSGFLMISTQPQSALALVGNTATFTVGGVHVYNNTNAPTYQWRTNGVNIAGATSATYTTPPLTLANNGAYYDCVVKAGALSATSQQAALTVSAAPGMSYADSVKADHPVVYYRFEESAGATTAVDSSGNGNNGVYENVSLSNPSASYGLGQAAGFSGSSSSLVTVPALGAASSLGGSGNDQVTIEAWINPAQVPGSVYAVDQWSTGIPHFIAEGGGTSMRFTLANSAPDDLNFGPTPAIAAGKWAYVVVVYDDTTLGAALYVNGEPVGTNYFTAAGTVSLDAGAIGVQTDGGDPPFNGLIDEVAVYTNALSLARIQEHYLAGTVPVPQIVSASRAFSVQNQVTVVFNVALQANSATNLANYVINNGNSVTGATIDGTLTTVTLTLANGIANNVANILTVSGVMNEGGSAAIPANSQVTILVTSDTVRVQDASDGLVVLEAEDYNQNLAGGGQSWVFTTWPPYLLPTGANTNFSGTGVMVVPDAGISYSFNPGDHPSNIPELDYLVYFNQAGVYTAWVRGAGDSDAAGANDSINLGLDGAIAFRINGQFPQSAGYAWGETPTPSGATFTVPTVGLHVVNAWMREDGFGFDKLILAPNPSYTPTGLGPAESVAALKPIAVAPSGGGFTLTWSAGGALQSSTNVSGPYLNVPGATNSPFTVPNPNRSMFYRVKSQ